MQSFVRTARSRREIFNAYFLTTISNQPPAGPPATIQTRVQSAPPARLPEALRTWSTNHRGSSDKSTHTHTRDTSVTPAGVPSAIHKALLSRHTGIGWSGGGGGSGTRGRTGSDGAEQRPPGRPLLRSATSAPSAQLERGQVQGSMAARGNAAAVTAAAAAAARAGGRVRTGRSSDRLGGRCSVCHEHAVCAARARSGAGKRGGAGKRDCRCRGAAVMWRGGRTTSARRTGRSSSASRAALKSRPSMGGEKPVGPRPVGGRTRFVSASSELPACDI